MLGTDEDEVFGHMYDKLSAERLRALVDSELEERERSVVLLRFGLGGAEPLPQREVGRKLGISRSYVSRIEKRALEKLAAALGGSPEGGLF